MVSKVFFITFSSSINLIIICVCIYVIKGLVTSNYNNIRGIKNEFHFLLICPVYENLRQKYINKRFQRGRNKQNFINIMSSDSIEQLTNLDTSMRLTSKAKDPQLTSVPLE